jgi:hypothetical protein
MRGRAAPIKRDLQSDNNKLDRVGRCRLTVPVGVATLLGEVLQPFECLGWGNHLPIAFGVLLEGWAHARFTSHWLVPFRYRKS